jgi:hypothetical protein
MVNRSPEKSLFEIVYGRTPKLAVTSQLYPCYQEHLAKQVKSTQEVCQHLEESYAKYKTATDKGRGLTIFREGNLVMVYLRKRRLPAGTSGKVRNKKYMAHAKYLRR